MKNSSEIMNFTISFGKSFLFIRMNNEQRGLSRPENKNEKKNEIQTLCVIKCVKHELYLK